MGLPSPSSRTSLRSAFRLSLLWLATDKSEKSAAEEPVSAGSSPLRGAVRLPQSAKAAAAGAAAPRHAPAQADGTDRPATVAQREPLIEPVTLPGPEPKFDKLARDITDMVPV